MVKVNIGIEQLEVIANGIVTINHNTTAIADEMRQIRIIFGKLCNYVFKIIMALITVIGGVNIAKLFIPGL